MAASLYVIVSVSVAILTCTYLFYRASLGYFVRATCNYAA